MKTIGIVKERKTVGGVRQQLGSLAGGGSAAGANGCGVSVAPGSCPRPSPPREEREQIASAAATGGEPEGYITKEEVARRLKKTVRTVENWQRRGFIPFIKAGRSVLFSWPDVVAHLQRNFRVCHLP